MSSLPNPIEFKDYKVELSKTIKFDNSTPDYDLSSIYEKMKENKIPQGYISQLFDIELLKASKNIQIVLKQFICYDNYNKSLAITLKENGKIVTVSIHRSKNKDDFIVKWKTLGSKKYIKSNIKDNFVFVVYGMAEIILCELLEMSYIAFQSDSIAKTLSQNTQFQDEIKPQLKGKYIIPLLDNDESCFSTIEPLKSELKDIVKTIVPLQMINLHYMDILINGGQVVKEYPKGYDFRDWCNEKKDISQIEEIISNCIKAEL